MSNMLAANPVGRPRKYSSPEEFDARVDEYAQYCKEEMEPVTWSGLALFLGFANRSCIDEYGKRPEFSYSVKRAKAFVEWNYEKMLAGGSNAAGSIFALKNMGWKDKHEVDNTSSDGSMATKGFNDFYDEKE